MNWRDLLQTEEEILTLPWVGRRSLPWTVEGKSPRTPGWYKFKKIGRKVKLISKSEDFNQEALLNKKFGYLIGDHFIPDDTVNVVSIQDLATSLEMVHLIDEGLDRFTRVSVGRVYDEGPLIFRSQEFPLGPEDQVLQSFYRQKKNIHNVNGVVPALDSAFRVETWRRDEAEKIRIEEERRIEKERKRKELEESIGTGIGRRNIAQLDFKAAAIASLTIGGAKYLDHRTSVNKNEMVVQYEVERRQLECVCNKKTLRIIDAGVCLADHRTGKKGDTLFTLESLPAVIKQAIRENKLVIWRHVGGYNNYDEEY